MTEQPDWINSQEAARILGVSLRTVQRKADTGQIPVVSAGFGRRTEYVFERVKIEEIAHKAS